MTLQRSYYSEDLRTFLNEDTDSVFGRLAKEHKFDLQENEKNAWVLTVRVLKEQLAGLEGHIMLEYSIPRMGRRADAVLLCAGMVFVIEFKVGAKTYLDRDLDQVTDYALDLKNFHGGSHDVPIVPVLVATDATPSPDTPAWDRNVSEPLRTNGDGLGGMIREAAASRRADPIDAAGWQDSGYCPTPTIIEAARTMYAEHDVDEISRHDAGVTNLTATTDAVKRIIDGSRRQNRKSICFITGVPGAGKTLAGLNIVHGVHGIPDGRNGDGGAQAVFLSGNGPLVTVLREALVRDVVERKKIERERRLNEGNPDVPRVTKKQERKGVEVFIQNVHAFRNEYLMNPASSPERVIVFDEAQRAWDRTQLENHMKSRHGQEKFGMSEPESLIKTMDRHRDWAVIVCLVGGGQEINRGETGLSGWISALAEHRDWDVYAPDDADIRHYTWGGHKVDALENPVNRVGELHLSTSIRSFRGRRVDEFVRLLLECDPDGARDTLERIGDYQIVMTRDFGRAKKWLKEQARGTERYGIVACAKSYRLQPHGIYVELTVDQAKWFLNYKDDPKSSYSLEYAATEFDVQGLEVDWACVAWDANLRYEGGDGGWTHRQFRGTKWNRIIKAERQMYLRNAYRVLLTRARQGMVIFMPEGDRTDRTRSPGFYDPTYEYLRGLGIKEL